MVKTPNFKLLANDVDVTSSIKTNLVSLSVQDEANDQADQLTLNITGAVKRPAYQDELKLYLGYDDKLSFIGLFQVQTTTRNNNYNLSVSCTSVNFSEVLKQHRDITYEKLSVKAICEQIAKRNNLEIKCDFDDVYYVSIAQQNESDLNFLNRLSKDLNAIFNIKNNTLVFLRKIKDDKKNSDLPSYVIDINNVESINIKHSNKTIYKACKATWHDTKENKAMEILEGVGVPVYIYKCNPKDVAEAKIKAAAKLQILNSGAIKGSLSVEGEIIFAGGVLNLKNSLEDDGKYSITRVTHALDSNGWKTNIEFED